MWRVYLGNALTEAISQTVDQSHFTCQFGDLRAADFSELDCVVPLSLGDYDALAGREALSGKKFWAPRSDIIDTCDDKLVLNRLLLGGKYAELIPPLPEKNGEQFPYILKKRRDKGGANAFIIRNPDDERAMSSAIESSEYFRQAYIAGNQEFALHMLLTNDGVAYHQTVRYEFGNKYYVRKRDHSARVTYLRRSGHVATFSGMLMELGYVGTCCVNYKMQRGAKLLEINPRVGSSLTSDINRYLLAYLNSLGVEQASGLTNSHVVPMPTFYPPRSLRSHLPYKVWQVLRTTRDTLRDLRSH